MRLDLYREVHKGLRSALAGQTFELGRLDVADRRAVRAFVEGFAGLCDLLAVHAEHEDQSVHPLLIQSYPELVAELEADHARVDEKLADTRRQIERLLETSAAERPAAALEAAHALNDFVAHYALHMLREEREAMPALWGLYDDGKLLEVQTAIRGAIAPPMMGRFMQHMLPAMNVEERTAAFSGLRDNAPPEALAAMCELAARVLPNDEWGAVKARVGV
jgi:hypothetical protein